MAGRPRKLGLHRQVSTPADAPAGPARPPAGEAPNAPPEVDPETAAALARLHTQLQDAHVSGEAMVEVSTRDIDTVLRPVDTLSTIGRRLADGEVPTIPPPVLYVLTKGTQGEAPVPEARFGAKLGASLIQGALVERLVERYQEDTGLTLAEALAVAQAEEASVGDVIDAGRLTTEERDALVAAERTLTAAAMLVHHVALDRWPKPDPDPAPPVPPLERTAAGTPTLVVDGAPITLTLADEAAAEALVQAAIRGDTAAGTVESGGAGWAGLMAVESSLYAGVHVALPSAAAAAVTARALIDKAALTPEELEARRLAARTRPDGSRVSGLRAWLDGQESRRFGALFSAVVRAMERRARDDAEQRVIEERDRREAAEREAAAARDAADVARQETERLARQLRRAKDRAEGLADRTVFPRTLITSGYETAPFKAMLQRIDQGELFPVDDAGATLAAIRRASEVVVHESQLGQLPPDQVRALFAVFRIFSTVGDDGRELPSALPPIPARLVYQAADVMSRRDADRRRVFEGLRACSSMELYVALTGDQDGRAWVMGERVRPFAMRPLWTASDDGRRKLTAAEARRIAEEWASLGTRGGKWEGPLPDAYAFDLPPIMRQIWGRLVLGGDVLERLDAGARAERGERESFSGLDWRLFIQVTQRVQYGQRSADGERFLSYVDRDALLADYYGVETIAKARRRGKLRKYLDQYEKAVGVLGFVDSERGDIARLEMRDYVTSEGERRDVFALNPAVMRGMGPRLEPPRSDGKRGRGRRRPAQAALPLPGATSDGETGKR